MKKQKKKKKKNKNISSYVAIYCFQKSYAIAQGKLVLVDKLTSGDFIKVFDF